MIFLALNQKIHELITQTVLPTAISPATVSGAGKLPVQSIPAVSLSSAIGLLEVLENEGDLELIELTRHVHIELTQLLLIVKAAEMLGWVNTPAGRVEMTVEGRKFLAADVAARKQQLNIKLRGLFVFDLIIKALNQSANNEINEEAVLTEFALMFPHERPQRILRTVVAWARYAELFKYNSPRKVLHGIQHAAAIPKSSK